MIYKLRLVNFPNSSVEDKVFRNLLEAKEEAEKMGFDIVVEGFTTDGVLSYMLGYSTINGWTK
tara:strand:- start:426 stop:614 length:189 start_codon:yes stop_codon:yes gene_type:complete